MVEKDGATFPGNTYVECLLKPVFNYQRDNLFSAMFQVHRAHVLMLCDRGILSTEQTARILDAVERVAVCDPAVLRYDSHFEDLFFMMEARLTEELGADLAGNMHIARSRNDMGVTMYRLTLRDQLLEILDVLTDLRESLLEVAGEHLETVMPAYTHTQPAQPTTLGHYLLAVQDVLTRDTERVWAAFHTVNQSPMGAAAITTTGFDICRDSVRKYLGFEGIVENSYDAIAGADYLLEAAVAIMMLMTNMGRWIQDLLLFCTREFEAVKVADPMFRSAASCRKSEIRFPWNIPVPSPAVPLPTHRRSLRWCTTRRSATSWTPRMTCSLTCTEPSIKPIEY